MAARFQPRVNRSRANAVWMSHVTEAHTAEWALAGHGARLRLVVANAFSRSMHCTENARIAQFAGPPSVFQHRRDGHAC